MAELPVESYWWWDEINAGGYPMTEIEFPFEHEGVLLEEDDGGLWVTVRDGSGEDTKPYWIGPRARRALRAARELI